MKTLAYPPPANVGAGGEGEPPHTPGGTTPAAPAAAATPLDATGGDSGTGTAAPGAPDVRVEVTEQLPRLELALGREEGTAATVGGVGG
jgi:hypothetical protein